jgi:hypothetical protein
MEAGTMSDIPPPPPGYSIVPQGRTRLTIDEDIPPPPPGFTIMPPEVPAATPAAPPVGRSFEDTALIRGLQSFGSFLADPPAGVRSLISPELAKIEEEQNRQARVPPLAEIIRRAGDAAFPAFGVQEYKPETPMGGLGEAAATGAVAGAPGGWPGMALGAAGNALGYTARQAIGEPKPGEPDWATRAEILASFLPGGVANRMGVRARSRESPPPSPGSSWSPRTFPPSELEAAGVNPTLGQAMGGVWNKIEQGLSSIPFIGDAMQKGRAGATEQFNTGFINDRVLKPVGEKLDPETPLGRPALDEAEAKITSKYDALEPRLSLGLDAQWRIDRARLDRDASMLRGAERELYDRLMAEEIDSKVGTNRVGVLSGRQFREIESYLGQVARDFRFSGDPHYRNYGNIVKRVQEALRSALERSNPADAAELARIHKSFSDLATIELAAERPGSGLGGRSEFGVVTPTKLVEAITQRDPTRSGFATGRSPNQSYAETGRKLLGDTVPDSGTPYRLAVGSGLLGGAAGLLDPWTAGTLGAGYLGTRLMYSPQGRAAMNYFLRRPEQAGLAGLLATQDDNLLPPPR